MGKRHKLATVNILNPDGTINENAKPYQGLDRFEARKRVVADLEKKGLFVRRDSHLHAVGHCYRCHTIVEPYLSKQWFVKMKPLAEKALKAHAEGKTKFYPDRWTKVYTNWLEGIRDWCISRQIWWGHQIPVWYCEDCKRTEIASSATPPRNDVIAPATQHGGSAESVGGKQSQKGIIVSRETPTKCPSCGSKNLRQDPDVLDTWFSSWLWPFSTLGWPATKVSAGKPEQIDDLKYFYPTSDLVTAPEIIFFWVARMIMAGLEFMGEVPFNRIYIHGTVRAQSGLKMSKSLGNAIDPLEVIEAMGADALRFSMIMLSAQDVYLSPEKFEVGRNFTNKIWNAARFVLMNLKDFQGTEEMAALDFKKLSLPQRWILSRLFHMTGEVERYLSTFGVAQAATEIYHFVWNDFCDWFIELSKPVLAGEDIQEKKKAQQILFIVLERILKLLEPFMPFISEEIWQHLKGFAQNQREWPETLMRASWPAQEKIRFEDAQAEHALDLVQKAVTSIRDMRASLQIAPPTLLKAVISSPVPEVRSQFASFEKEIKKLARLEELKIEPHFKKSKAYIGAAFKDLEVFLYIEGLVDVEKERARIQKKIEESRLWIASLRKKISDENFVKNAPPEVVEKERERLLAAEKILKSHEEHLALFQ
jgi:valyl-tRNA synthetase